MGVLLDLILSISFLKSLKLSLIPRFPKGKSNVHVQKK